MTTLQEAKSQSVQLHTALQELKNEFAVLGAAMRIAADNMGKNGVPPASDLQAAMESTTTDFLNQRQKILKFAENCFGLCEKPYKEEPQSLDDLETCLNHAVEVVLKQHKERSLEPLRKATTVNRRKGFFVPQVEEFKKQSQKLLNKLQACELSDFEKELLDSQKQIDAFSAMVDLVEGGEVLDDDQCEGLRQTAVKFFEKTLVMAALRGHLFLDRGANTPELPSFESPKIISSSAKKEMVEEKEIVSIPDEPTPAPAPAPAPSMPEASEPPKEQLQAPSQFIGWPQNGWEKSQEKKGEEKEEKIAEQTPIAPSVLESRKFKKEVLRPLSFIEYRNFSEKCVALEKLLEKTPFHEIIMAAITQRKIDDALDFSRLRKAQAEGTIQALQDWVAMSRDLKATSHEIKSVLTACGFDVSEIHQERRHRIGFSAVCKPSERVNFPEGYEMALITSKYRISCFWGNPSEEMLLLEAADALPDEISLIFHFGCLTDEHRFDLAKICKEGNHKLLILDDLLILHLFTMTNNRLQDLFNGALPASYAEKLSFLRMN